MRVCPHHNFRWLGGGTAGNRAQPTRLPLNTARYQTGTKQHLKDRQFENSRYSKEAIYSNFDSGDDTTRQSGTGEAEATESQVSSGDENSL